jgi:putative membrane protein
MVIKIRINKAGATFPVEVIFLLKCFQIQDILYTFWYFKILMNMLLFLAWLLFVKQVIFFLILKMLTMKMLTTSVITCLALSLSLLSCSKDDDNNNDLNAQDRTFMMQASMGNSAEVAAGALASTKGDSVGIRSFGQMMVTDHSTAQTDLKTLGTNVNVGVKDSVDAAHITLGQTLQGLSGRAFDSTYIVNQINDHQTTISAFQTEISSGGRTEVINYANKYLPKIQMHLQMADSIATAMGFK